MGKVQNCFSSLRDLTVDFSAMGYCGCQTSTRVKKKNNKKKKQSDNIGGEEEENLSKVI